MTEYDTEFRGNPTVFALAYNILLLVYEFKRKGEQERSSPGSHSSRNSSFDVESM